MDTKICRTCGIDKPISEFSKGNDKCRLCVKTYMHKWHADNPQKNKEYQHRWYIANLDKKYAGSRKWAIANPERTKEIFKKWQISHPEKVRINCCSWNMAHPKEKKIYDAKYRICNKEKIQVYKSKNRALKLNAPGNGITAIQWEQLREEYNYTCVYCGKREPEIKLTIDHVEPLINGGAHDITNAVPSCEHCNKSKHAKSLLFWLYSSTQEI